MTTCSAPPLEVPPVNSQILHNQWDDIVVNVLDKVWMIDSDGNPLVKAPVRLDCVRVIFIDVVNFHGNIEPSKPGVPDLSDILIVVVNVVKLYL
jgi:hypothetical protein